VTGAGAVSLGMVVLYRWRAGRAPEAGSASLWVALHIAVLGMCVASFRGRPRLSALRDHAPLLVPLAAALVTHLYALTDVPTNIHFDFVWSSMSALELLDGRLASVFQPGFVPVPVVGLIPEMIGFLLAGPTEVGFRLGPALAGISGVLAAYILGTAWRGRATGLFGAIFLAGAVPWIHFSRMSTTGVSAVAGLWLLALFALALKTGQPGWWLAGGWVAGWCFYLWPSARAAPVAVFLAGILLAFRSPRAAARRWFGPPLMALAFAVWIVPLVPAWMAMPDLALPRAQESLDVFKPQGGLDTERLKAAFGRPLAQSAGWFFSIPDTSSQGSMSPALNTEEATLLVAGLALALVAGFSVNVLLVLYVVIVILALGAFATSPPWYTRLLPSLPVACVLMGFAMATLLDFLRLSGRKLRGVMLALAAAAALAFSPAANLRRYVRYEREQRPMWEATAIARQLHEIARGRTAYLVTTGRADWELDVRQRPPRLGEMLPWVWDLHLVEVRELDDALPFPPGPKVVVVLAERAERDLPRIRAAYPEARIREVPDVNGPWARFLLIDDEAGRLTTPPKSRSRAGEEPVP